MRDIIYDVAVTLDGFIAAPGGDVSTFPMEGPHADAYGQRLAGYSTVIMGRATYEFGYAYGLPPGARAYPRMDHHIFSQSGHVPTDKEVRVIAEDWLDEIARLRQSEGGAIYLCGGGQFAGFVANAGHLTDLVLKRVPISLGDGIPLFKGLDAPLPAQPVSQDAYANGVALERYKITGIG
ncbi:MAG: dihydrofolate reductase family protein [Pseudomonadota bacterium]